MLLSCSFHRLCRQLGQRLPVHDRLASAKECPTRPTPQVWGAQSGGMLRMPDDDQDQAELLSRVTRGVLTHWSKLPGSGRSHLQGDVGQAAGFDGCVFVAPCRHQSGLRRTPRCPSSVSTAAPCSGVGRQVEAMVSDRAVTLLRQRLFLWFDRCGAIISTPLGSNSALKSSLS